MQFPPVYQLDQINFDLIVSNDIQTIVLEQNPHLYTTQVFRSMAPGRMKDQDYPNEKHIKSILKFITNTSHFLNHTLYHGFYLLYTLICDLHIPLCLLKLLILPQQELKM